MQYLVIVQKLYIAWKKINIQTQLITRCQFINQIQRIGLLCSQWRYVWMALCRINKVTCVNTGDPLFFGIKHGQFIGLVVAFRDLAFAVYMKPPTEHFQ